MKKILFVLAALFFVNVYSHLNLGGGSSMNRNNSDRKPCFTVHCLHAEDDEESAQPLGGNYNVDLNNPINFASGKSSSCDESCKAYRDQMSEKLKGVNNDGGIPASGSSNKSSQE